MKKISILFALFIGLFGYSQTYRLYQTDNIHNQLKLNTKTGQVYQIQDDGQTFLVREAETPNNEKRIGIFCKKPKIYGLSFFSISRQGNCGNVNLVLVIQKIYYLWQ